MARATLRLLLGRYLDSDPARLRFCYGAHDKPALAPESGGDSPRFNVSHSHGLALIALTRSREIGVDLEQIRPEIALENIARRFFSQAEVATLFALPPRERGEAFFACWTRKEAYIKAKGGGLTIPLDQFDVSLGRGKPAAILSTRWDPTEACRWSLRDLYPGPGYAAAVAVEGDGGHLACFQWSG
jgi:4'-phosphopantetheinyl transferase